MKKPENKKSINLPPYHPATTFINPMKKIINREFNITVTV